MQKKPIPEFALPGWQIWETEYNDPIIGKAGRITAWNGSDVEYHVVWKIDVHNAARKDSLEALKVAVARFIANPADYYRRQYEQMRAYDAAQT